MGNIKQNRINGVIKGRIKGLIAQLEESKIVDHSASKGSLREKYLRDFLQNVLPQNFIVSGGFICDSIGKISLQLDLILSDISKLPQILLGRDISLIPVESAISSVEIKSILTDTVFDQTQNQIESIKILQPIGDGIKEGVHGVRHFIFAYESQVSDEKVLKWFSQTNRLFGVCILGDKYFYRAKGKIKVVEEEDYDEVIVFLSSLIHSIIKSEDERISISKNIWRHYLVGVNPSNLVYT